MEATNKHTAKLHHVGSLYILILLCLIVFVVCNNIYKLVLFISLLRYSTVLIIRALFAALIWNKTFAPSFV
jgi:hypothetical protein